MKLFIGSRRVSRLINLQQVKSFILNHGSHVKWLSNVSVFIAIAVDTSEMHFFRRKNTSICVRLYKTEDCCLSVCLSVCLPVCLPACLPACLSVCLSVLLMNKTSTNSLIFYFDKAKQKNVCSGYMKKYSTKIFCFC